ncbi:MAG: tRNA 5-methoxyuridine(34)/uridine 5-oxyacetic acid(34) synthase CmoB [Wenzhouxiangellaceae bacterium]
MSDKPADIDTLHPGLSDWLQHTLSCDDVAREKLLALLQQRWQQHNHGDMPRWQQTIQTLSRCRGKAQRWRVDDDLLVLGKAASSGGQQMLLEQALRELMPWRKGPLRLHGVYIDTEWRSDWKWQRLQAHLPKLSGHKVLDVGAGNGYFAYRLLAAGAAGVLAVDPTWLFVMQHQAMQTAAGAADNWVLPLRLEDLPDSVGGFDMVMSLGVLYHRRDPLAHLHRLKQHLRPGGLLVLETFVLPPGDDLEISPRRYARMGNVHRIPQPPLLRQWLQDTGFSNVRMVDINRTSVQEQRRTDWMQFESLAEGLDQYNHALTVEGLPAPRRAIMLARQNR